MSQPSRNDLFCFGLVLWDIATTVVCLQKHPKSFLRNFLIRVSQLWEAEKAKISTYIKITDFILHDYNEGEYLLHVGMAIDYFFVSCQWSLFYRGHSTLWSTEWYVSSDVQQRKITAPSLGYGY